MFSNHVRNEIDYYVYRLIDPRNGETFYVGKGRGNRVFNHIQNAQRENGADYKSDKTLLIREIQLTGLEVTHVIHRHGLTEKVAFEVEGALMDAYPNTTNVAEGHGNEERGAMHSLQIIEQYEPEEAVINHNVLAISINRMIQHLSIYDAVRFAWRVNLATAERMDYVLAVNHGVIVGVFSVTQWLPATIENFPNFEVGATDEGRYGFVGESAPEDIADQYIRRQLGEAHQMRQNPLRYLGPELYEA